MCAVAVAALLVASACSGDDRDGDAASAAAPCDLFRESDASALLGAEVEQVDFVDLFERANGPIPEDRRPAVEEAATRNCAYAQVDDDALAAVQLDQGLFESVEQFRSSWDDETEILSAPGLAASFDADGEEHAGAVSVLLNDDGDSFALAVYRADPGRDQLLNSASELTERYSP